MKSSSSSDYYEATGLFYLLGSGDFYFFLSSFFSLTASSFLPFSYTFLVSILAGSYFLGSSFFGYYLTSYFFCSTFNGTMT
jgi:hypothetical protein